MRYFSMFSGIGGFELGIKYAYQEKQGNDIVECIGYSEIDKYAIQIYEKHFKHKNYGDATKIDTNKLPDFDLLVAGFPCQAFSIAGKRKGFNDTRGTLFFEIARVLRDKRPRYFLLENVKGLLSHEQGKTFQTILGVLTDLGYGVEWQVLNSKNFGVPQNRERVFIIGYLRGTSRPKVFPIGENGKFSDKEQQQPIFGKIQTRKQKDSSNANRKDVQNGKDGQLHYIGGIEGKRKKWLEDGKNNSRNFSQGQRIYSVDGISQILAGNAGGQGGKTGLYAIRQPLKFLQRNQKNIEGDYSFTVDGANTGGLRQGTKIRRLTPTECERLQGFPDGWTEGASDTQRYKCLGNAVTVNVIKAIMERWE